jgi:hypothetical protein
MLVIALALYLAGVMAWSVGSLLRRTHVPGLGLAGFAGTALLVLSWLYADGMFDRLPAQPELELIADVGSGPDPTIGGCLGQLGAAAGVAVMLLVATRIAVRVTVVSLRATAVALRVWVPRLPVQLMIEAIALLAVVSITMTSTREPPLWCINQGRFPTFWVERDRGEYIYDNTVKAQRGNQHPGSVRSGEPLVSTTGAGQVSRLLQAWTRRDACKKLRGTARVPGRPKPKDPAVKKWSCDEYPYATTLQGGIDSRAAWVPQIEQESQGGQLSRFHAENNLVAGSCFWVETRVPPGARRFP